MFKIARYHQLTKTDNKLDRKVAVVEKYMSFSVLVGCWSCRIAREFHTNSRNVGTTKANSKWDHNRPLL